MNWLAVIIAAWFVLGILGSHFAAAISRAKKETPMSPLIALTGLIAFITAVAIAIES